MAGQHSEHMVIKSIFVDNFKSLRNFNLSFNADLNIIVGNNEAGKSTILEAIDLALTGQLKGKPIFGEISQFLFNQDAVSQFKNSVLSKTPTQPPKITIEIYLEDQPEVVHLKGTNNTKRKNCPGISLIIEFDEENYLDMYQEYIKETNESFTIPIEYYAVKWYGFDYSPIHTRKVPIKSWFIDTTNHRLQSGTDTYIKQVLSALPNKEKAQLSLAYRNLKESFGEHQALIAVNTLIAEKQGALSDHDLKVSFDVSQKSAWESNLTSYLRGIPFQHIGKGEQSTLKMLLSLELKGQDKQVLLIEEPETHLSHSNMANLISKIALHSAGKQVIITTHSGFVLNKLGLGKVIILGDGGQSISLKGLANKDTERYFMKLPGFDTLRLALADKVILVEGPSDELFVQKAYMQTHNGRLPLDDGIDVITVRGLAFERFLEVAVEIKKTVAVVTDNDGEPENLNSKYSAYATNEDVLLCYSQNAALKTLEDHIVDCNDFQILNNVLGYKTKDKDALLARMKNKNNKTEWAMKVFESNQSFNIPDYVQKAIK